MFQFQSSDILAVRPGDWEPVGRREPLPRIENSPVWPAELPAVKTVGDMLADAHRAKEADRIWRAVREAAGGTVEAEPVVEVATIEMPDPPEWPNWCPEDLTVVANPGWMEREARTAYQLFQRRNAEREARLAHDRKMAEYREAAMARHQQLSVWPIAAPSSPAHASNGVGGYKERSERQSVLRGPLWDALDYLKTNDELLARLKASASRGVKP